MTPLNMENVPAILTSSHEWGRLPSLDQDDKVYGFCPDLPSLLQIARGPLFNKTEEELSDPANHLELAFDIGSRLPQMLSQLFPNAPLHYFRRNILTRMPKSYKLRSGCPIVLADNVSSATSALPPREVVEFLQNLLGITDEPQWYLVFCADG